MYNLGYMILYTIALILVIIIMVLCIKNENIKKKASFLLMCICVIISTLLYTGYLHSQDTMVMQIFLSLSFISTDLILFFALAFIETYIGNKRNILVSDSLFALIILDAIFIIINAKNGTTVDLALDNRIYLDVNINGFFIYHIVLCLVMFLFNVSLLLSKTITSAKCYKAKYMISFSLVSVIGLLKMVLFAIASKIDYSILIYSFAIITIYYFFFIYSPVLLTKKIEDLIMNNMLDCIIAFDANENSIYVNERAINLLGSGIKDLNKTDFIKKYSFVELEKKVSIIKYNNEDVYLSPNKKVFIDYKKRVEAYLYLLEDVTLREIKEKNEEYYSSHDDLTKIYNNNYFNIRYNQIIDEISLYEMAVINFTDFKLINNVFGSNQGDFCLIKAAETLKNVSTNYFKIYARISADKFVILSKKNTIDYNYLQKMIFENVTSQIKELPINVKIGVCRECDSNPDDTVKKCLATLNYIKNKINENVGYYNDDVEGMIIKKNQLLIDIDRAIEQHEFLVYYQPQINSYDNRLVGAEALVRWLHPKYNMVSPGEFIPLFEEHMLITKLDKYVWEEACIFLNKWHGKYPNLSISINISVNDFYQMDVCSFLVNLITKYEIAPKNLKLEITESAFASDRKMIIDKVDELHKNHFIVEMDDFGSGYSSFNTLKDIPIDVLKMDMKFINGDLNNYKAKEILNSIIAMAHKIHMPVIAEGVETKEQCELLSQMDCDLIQGYYYSKPLPEDDFVLFLEGIEVSSFVEFWTSSNQNKLIFSMFKDIHQCFNNSPVCVVIVGPHYNANNIIDDYIVYYCNPSFLEASGLNASKTTLKKMSDIYSNWRSELLDSLNDVLINGVTFKKLIEDGDKKVFLQAYSIENKYVSIVITYLNDAKNKK